MRKVKIIADSTCDLNPDLLARHDVTIAPLYVAFGEKSYRDSIDVTSDAVLSYCEANKETPKTSATSVGDFIEIFKPFVERGQDIVFISISSSMSAEHQNALLASAEFPGCTIRCVDSQNITGGNGLLVLEAAERAAAGMSAGQIADEIEALREKVNTSFVLDTLTYLRRGGRCSGLAALGAAVLNIKPEISVMQGKMAPTHKYRGNITRVAMRYVENQLADLHKINPRRIFIAYSTFALETISEIVEKVRALEYFEEVLLVRAGCVITSHCGPGTLGVLFMYK